MKEVDTEALTKEANHHSIYDILFLPSINLSGLAL